MTVYYPCPLVHEHTLLTHITTLCATYTMYLARCAEVTGVLHLRSDMAKLRELICFEEDNTQIFEFSWEYFLPRSVVIQIMRRCTAHIQISCLVLLAACFQSSETSSSLGPLVPLCFPENRSKVFCLDLRAFE